MVFIRVDNNSEMYCDGCAKDIKDIQDKIADKKYKQNLKARK